MLTISKPMSILPVREKRILWYFSKQISKLFFQMSAQVYSFLAKLKREGKPFWSKQS